MAQGQLAISVSCILPISVFGQSTGFVQDQRSAGTFGGKYIHVSKVSLKDSKEVAGVRSNTPKRKYCQTVRCSYKSAQASESGNKYTNSRNWDPDLSGGPSVGSAVGFKLSDFELCSHVSVGLAGRGDEVLFEGVVRNPASPLKGMRVVLRQLASRRAQIWGHRALQVLSSLLPREDMKLSYATPVHGYILAPGADGDSATLTLVHGYNGSYSLHQWLHSEDWLSELETWLSLDEKVVRRVGDLKLGGPRASRQHRLVRILMRDLLIGVNYLHSRGYAHTELRLQNIQVNEADRHVKVGLLGNASAFPESSTSVRMGNISTRQLMIAYDVRCVGFIMAKMVLRELMNPSTFALLKTFLIQGHDPAGLREFLLPILERSPSNCTGIQVMDKDGGAGWHLLASMLAIKPTNRLSCTDALRHPFLCGPLWRVQRSVDLTRWTIGSTAVRIVEEYVYGLQQKTRLAELIEMLERKNPNSSAKEWRNLVGGRWRFLYHTGRQIGLTRREASPVILMKNVLLSMDVSENGSLSMVAEIVFTALGPGSWPYDKSGINGTLKVCAPIVSVIDGERLYITEEEAGMNEIQALTSEKLSTHGNRTKPRNSSVARDQPHPASVPIVRLVSACELEINLDLDYSEVQGSLVQRLLREVRFQIPQEMFDLTRIVCGTYVDSRLMVVRGVSGSASLFVRSV